MIKLFRFLKQYTLQIVAIVVLIFIQVLANLYLPTLTADIVDKGIVQKDVVQNISFLGFSGSYKGVDYILRLGGIMLLNLTRWGNMLSFSFILIFKNCGRLW